jgi:hypothetical protein
LENWFAEYRAPGGLIMILTATPESNEIKIGPGKMSVDLRPEKYLASTIDLLVGTIGLKAFPICWD